MDGEVELHRGDDGWSVAGGQRDGYPPAGFAVGVVGTVGWRNGLVYLGHTLGVRTYGDSERAYGADGRVKLGPIALGGGVEHATGDSELTGAWYYEGDEGGFVEWALCDAG